MPLTTFTWVPSYTSELAWTPSLNEIKFGDGYEQSMPDGINNAPVSFNVIFRKIPSAEAAAIVNFLKARGGNEPFYFLPPPPYNAVTLVWKCKNYRHTYDEANGESVIAEFKQTFNAT